MSRALFQIELPLREEWQSVELLRSASVACLAVTLPVEEQRERLGMVVAELLENAIKYGDWSRDVQHLPASWLRIEGDARRIEIQVCNPVLAADPNLERLFVELRRISAAESPEAAYLERMRDVAGTGATGGLGLARIAYETGCHLTAEIAADGTLRVCATTPPARSG